MTVAIRSSVSVATATESYLRSRSPTTSVRYGHVDHPDGDVNRCQDALDEWRRQKGLDAYLVMQVHDELVFDFPRAGCPRKSSATSNLKCRQRTEASDRAWGKRSRHGDPYAMRTGVPRRQLGSG